MALVDQIARVRAMAPLRLRHWQAVEAAVLAAVDAGEDSVLLHAGIDADMEADLSGVLVRDVMDALRKQLATEGLRFEDARDNGRTALRVLL